MTTEPTEGYALRLSDAELTRYRMMAEVARAAEADLWELAGLRSGAAIADVGCGPGAMLPALVDAVGEQGSIVAIDGTEHAVEQARALVDANGWTNVAVRIGRAEATGVPPGSLDTVMMRHVLAHNGPIEQEIVRHLATLVKPGGCVYLVDSYSAAFGIEPDDPDLADLNAAYSRFHAARGNDLRIGLRLGPLLEAAGLEVAAYRGWFNIVHPRGEMRPPAWAAREAMVEAGIATAADLRRWQAAFERLLERSPTIFAPMFGAVGRRP